jgi:hypothetical protein
MERDRKVKAQEPEEDWEKNLVILWALVEEHPVVVLVGVAVEAEAEEECGATGNCSKDKDSKQLRTKV